MYVFIFIYIYIYTYIYIYIYIYFHRGGSSSLALAHFHERTTPLVVAAGRGLLVLALIHEVLVVLDRLPQVLRPSERRLVPFLGLVGDVELNLELVGISGRTLLGG